MLILGPSLNASLEGRPCQRSAMQRLRFGSDLIRERLFRSTGTIQVLKGACRPSGRYWSRELVIMVNHG